MTSARSGWRWLRNGAALALAMGGGYAGLTSAGCTRQGVVTSALDAAVDSAYRPDAPALAAGEPSRGRFLLLAGDLHCHVSPPDDPSHVSRDLGETIELARSERLDFVVLTPHVRAGFFLDPEERALVVAGAAAMREETKRLDPGGVMFIPGFEYTDHRFGHVGAAFADLEAVLAAVPPEVLARHPERFFEEFVARGGVLVVNHPLVTPLDSIFSMARADLSWRPWTVPRGAFPPEIQAVGRLADGYEAYNLTVTHLRDRYLVGDTERTLRATLARIDQEIVARGRRISPLGGSDSHSSHLRATTFVLAAARSQDGVRDGLRAGRVCVRAPEACSLEVRPVGGAWASVGGSIRAPEAIEARARGGAVEIVVDGRVVAAPEEGEAVRIDVPAGRCSVVRAHVGEGFSAPVYVNCAFAG